MVTLMQAVSGNCIVKKLMSVGFERAAPEWKSVFRHKQLDLLLVIYVDDF